MEHSWELYGLFASAFLAATVLPFSSEAVFAACLLAGIDPVTCIVVATAGNSLGGGTNLLLGRFSRKFYERKGRTVRGETIIRKYGSWTAWLSWVPFIGDPLLIAAGFFRTPLVWTSVFMIAGKCARYVVIWWAIR
jgi:membrane protein YqaA with SNARE-associated domain